MRPVIAIMEREVAAVMALVAGRREEAVDMLRAAAEAEAALPPPLGPAKPIKPAAELLGEVLLGAGRPREAAEAFQQSLRRNANRTLSVLGLARAAAAAGDADAARDHYRAVLANYAEADKELAELSEARRAIDGSGPLPEAASASNATMARGIPIGIGVAGALAGVALIVRSRARRRLLPAGQRGTASGAGRPLKTAQPPRRKRR